MNSEQTKGALRNVVSLICGYMVGRGWINQDLATLIIGLAVAVGPIVWTIVDNTKRKQVANVEAMPEVKGVVTQPTVAGKALAESVVNGKPNPTVAPAGTTAAAAIARS